ncbi:MAG: ribbon-helix-helix domain-containing protein [Promethearchaeota archaeon]
MQIVTVNLPSFYVDAIAKLTKQGLYPSRSEAIRVALMDFLKKELKMVEALLSIKQNKDETIETDVKKEKKIIDMRSIRRGWPEKK